MLDWFEPNRDEDKRRNDPRRDASGEINLNSSFATIGTAFTRFATEYHRELSDVSEA